ncbi:unnamed protein product [Rotaria sordida]|uniref:Uncharacterized protein n=1 Tax=Rotaria sordida TaxID=392033 RepID=A0A815JRV0_9BILA|nr:unnamed protein product [Rotaria sordida]
MLSNLKLAPINKLEEQESYCIIKWEDTKKIEIIARKYILLPPSKDPEDNVSYLIDINDEKRLGRVLVHGTKEHCESILQEFLLHEPKSQDKGLVKEKISQNIVREIPIEIRNKKQQPISDEPLNEKCRVN